MAEKLAQLKKKGGGGGSKKNMLFAFCAYTDPVYYNEDLFTRNGNALIAKEDIDATVWIAYTGYGTAAHSDGYAYLYYNNTNISVHSDRASSATRVSQNIHINAGSSISFYYDKNPGGSCVGYLTE